MEIDLSSCRKRFENGQWWYVKADVYKAIRPNSKSPAVSQKSAFSKMRAKGIDIPTSYCLFLSSTGQSEAYACTNDRGVRITAEYLLKRKLGNEANFAIWKKKLNALVTLGKVRMKEEGCEKWYAASEMINALRGYYQTSLYAGGTFSWISKKYGGTKYWKPWGARKVWLHARGERNRSYWSWCIPESHLQEFFLALSKLQKRPRK